LDLNYYIRIFKEAFKLSLEKFKKHVENHPAVPLFKAIRCFDPRCIQSNSNYHIFSTYFIIKEFNDYTDDLIYEWGIYCNLQENFDDNFDLDSYWNQKINTLPTLSSIALKYIWLPVSGVDVERSFSNYKSILSDKRMALKEDSIKKLNFMYFNFSDN
jgi:hypothetical protein